ncbi:MAG: BON domain-containing protein [Burkholderiaceae bacterium]|nr:BON domain-containing protein [Burkholderiaceae bacterium]MCX7900984.1 BON domain-containing protein [Burkholderiaceae bacterium]
MRSRTGMVLAVAVLAGGVLSACVPLAIGAAVGAAAVAVDRRSVGIQLEDEAIERRLDRAIYGRFKGGEEISVYVTSYNRKVLLTGQVINDAIYREVERIAQQGENVREVVNELQVRELSPATVRNNDIAISAKVRAALLKEQAVPLGAVKVTTERGIVYLLGRVTVEEGDAAALVASRVSGVNKVVKVFDYLTAEELAAIQGGGGTAPARR